MHAFGLTAPRVHTGLPFIAEAESRYSVAIIRRWLRQTSDYSERSSPGDLSNVSGEQEHKSWT